MPLAYTSRSIPLCKYKHKGSRMQGIQYDNSKTREILIEPERIFKCFYNGEIKKSAFFTKDGNLYA